LRPRGYTRRTLLRQLALLGAGVGAAWWVRERYLFPKPDVAFPAGAAATSWTRLPDPSGLIEMTAVVAGIPLRVVVDSGAQYSVIDRALAARLGLKAMPLPMLAFGVSGAPSVTHTVGLDFSLGGLAIRGVRAATLELLSLSGAIRRPFAMLIGRDVLQAVTADVDWPGGRVRFVKPGAYDPEPGAHVVPTHSRGGALMTPVRIEGAAPVDLMIDTGATSEIALSENTARGLGLLSGRPVITGRSVSLGGFSLDRVVRARSVEFAGQRLADVEVQVFTPAVHGPMPDGLLGVGVLRRYRAGLDVGAGVLWLSPAAVGSTRRTGPRAVLGT
jgi:predicted aspartyl protease